MYYLCLQKWLKGFSWNKTKKKTQKTSQPSFSLPKNPQATSHGKVSPSYITTTTTKTIYGKNWTSLYLYLSICIWQTPSATRLSLLLQNCCFSGQKNTAQQHVQPRKKSRKSQTATELIEQKTKGHFTTSLSLLPYSTHGPGACPHGENLADRRRRAPGKETSIGRAALTRSRGFKSPTRVGLDKTLHVTEERGQGGTTSPHIALR